MNDARDGLRNPARRLPDIALPRVGSEGEELLRSGRRESVVLILAHGTGCAQCAAHVQELAAVDDELRSWDARVFIIVPPIEREAPDQHVEVPPVFVTLQDERRQLSAVLGTEGPAIVVADQWGEIQFLGLAGEDHEFIEPAEVVKWVQYLAVRCPECEGESL